MNCTICFNWINSSQNGQIKPEPQPKLNTFRLIIWCVMMCVPGSWILMTIRGGEGLCVGELS